MPSFNPSGVTVPIWYDQSDGGAARMALTTSARVDVCVVGAGISGLTTAYRLAREGRRVMVLDEKPVAGGESGRTSAHLSSVLDDRFKHMEQSAGLEATRLMHESHSAAIDMIEQTAAENGIDCGFRRVDGHLFSGRGEKVARLEEEYAAAQRVGVGDMSWLNASPTGVDLGPCIRFGGQAAIQPLVYLQGVAHAIERLGGVIHCGQRVVRMAGAGPVEVQLANGITVQCAAGVAATNTPSILGQWQAIHTKQAAYRTYVIGLAYESGPATDALYWDMTDPYHYVRMTHAGGARALLVGGEDHKTGHNDGAKSRDRFARLEEWAQKALPGVGSRVAQWSGQVYEPIDGAAFIGRAPVKGLEGCYVITGDSGMGLTHGTLGAKIVTDLIQGRDNPWAEVYDPGRGISRGVGEFLRENVEAASHLVDYISPGDIGSADEIPDGSGAVIRDGMQKLAVYRDSEGRVHQCSAICPHLKCLVHWNATERSWDCPCHGSRFTGEGKLIIGPATEDLREM